MYGRNYGYKYGSNFLLHKEKTSTNENVAIVFILFWNLQGGQLVTVCFSAFFCLLRAFNATVSYEKKAWILSQTCFSRTKKLFISLDLSYKTE